MAGYRSILFLASSEPDSDTVALRKLTQAFVGPGASVFMLYVAAHHVTGFGDATARGHIANDMQIKQEVFPRLKLLCERYEIPSRHIHIEVGDPVPTIERYVRDHGIELLVISAAHQSANGKLIPLLDTCPCDLHIIR